MVWLIEKCFQAVVWLALTAVQVFLGYIDICDAAVTTLAIWLILHPGLGWNGWWALAASLAVALIGFAIFKNRIGFWIVSPLFSAFWSWLVVRVILCSIFKEMNQIVFWVLAIAAFAGILWLHDYARDRKQLMEILAADEAAAKAAALAPIVHYDFDKATGQLRRRDAQPGNPEAH